MLNRKYSCLYIVLFAAILALLSLSLGHAQRRLLTDEWGPVENVGTVLYVVAIVMLIGDSRYDRPFFIHTAIVLTIMTARELDFQTAFSSKNILNKNFYRHGAEGFSHEQIGAVIALAIIGLVVLAYGRYLPRLIANVKKGKAFAFSIVIAILSIPASVFADGSYRVLHEEWGLPLPLVVKHFTTSFEEFLETLLPIMIIFAILQYRADRHRESAAAPPSRENP